MTANTKPLPRMVDGIGRRARIELRHPTEQKIAQAEEYVESLGADPLLTDALVKLQQARELVAEWLEGGQKPEPPRVLTLAEQFAVIRTRYPGASMEKSPRQFGGFIVTIPHFPLPEGYDRQECMLHFVLPDGYPYAVPVNFYTDAVRMADGSMPYMAHELTRDEDLGGIVPVPRGTMAWAWQVQCWEAQSDTMRTYVSVINARLADLHARDHSTIAR